MGVRPGRPPHPRPRQLRRGPLLRGGGQGRRGQGPPGPAGPEYVVKTLPPTLESWSDGRLGELVNIIVMENEIIFEGTLGSTKFSPFGK